MALSPDEQAAFVDAASALLAARERIEFVREHPRPLGAGVQSAAQQTIKVILGLCRKGNGISALRFRGYLFYPVLRPNGTIDTLHIVPEAEIVDIPG